MFLSTLSRRRLIQLMAASAALPLAGTVSFAQQAAVRAVVLSDLHSAYDRLPQVLAAVAAEIAGGANLILINGDIFELGNVAAARSAGRADWQFLEKLAALAPVVVNIGNHEPDFDNDLAQFVSQANALGISVISNILDSRTGAEYAPSHAMLEIGGAQVVVVGIATNALNTYPKASREHLTLPAPVEWAKANVVDLLAMGTVGIVLSHAGVVADRDILPLLPAGTLLVGGHDHLVLTHAEGDVGYVHTGSWSSLMTLASLAAGTAPVLQQVVIDRDGAGDAELAATIAAVLDEHLTDEEKASIGSAPEAMSLGETGRYVAQVLAAAAGADIGFIGHTSFGTGFPAAPISLYEYNSILRFEGKIVTATVDAATLRDILARVNQDGDIALDARTGDFLYAAPEDLADKDSYVIACNDWSGINQKAYFGREDLVFTEVPGLMLKPTVRDTLQ